MWQRLLKPVNLVKADSEIQMAGPARGLEPQCFSKGFDRIGVRVSEETSEPQPLMDFRRGVQLGSFPILLSSALKVLVELGFLGPLQQLIERGLSCLRETGPRKNGRQTQDDTWEIR